MAFTFRNKRLGYDNIAVGSATGIEIPNGTTARELPEVEIPAAGHTSTTSKFNDNPAVGASTS